MEMSDDARGKKKKGSLDLLLDFVVSGLADKEQTKNKNWSYMPPFCLINFFV